MIHDTFAYSVRVGHLHCSSIKTTAGFKRSRQLQRICFPQVSWPVMLMSKSQGRRLRAMLCFAFLLLVAWVRATFPHYGSALCFSSQFIMGGASSHVTFRAQQLRTTVEAAGENQVGLGQQIWWVKMNNYQQQVWALSNALAGLLRDSEASKFPPTLRAKTMELQQSCNGLEQYISTSTSRIQWLRFVLAIFFMSILVLLTC